MSSSAGREERPQGRERRAGIGRAFIRRVALRIRGGSSTPETTSSHHSIGEEPVEELVVDEGGGGSFGEAEVMHPPVAESERLDRNARNFDVTQRSYLHSTAAHFQPSIRTNATSAPVTYVRGIDRQERTRRLLAKYGLSMETLDWTPPESALPSTVLRVEKPIRMRIRYACHLCEKSFGSERNCKACNHKRCEQCPRHPSKRNQPRNGLAHKQSFDSGNNVVIRRKREHEEVENERTSPSRSSSKSKTMSDRPTAVPQLLQHTCHKCKTVFEQRGRLCSSCGHLKCTRCPGNLSDTNYSRSGDSQLRSERVYRPPRQRVRWICDHCQSTFSEGCRVCAECLHKRCDACSRIPYVLLYAAIISSSANTCSPKRPRLDQEENNETIQDRARGPGIS
jgi:hypothetical protein